MTDIVSSIIGLIFVGAFQLVGFFPFIIVAIVIVRVIKKGNNVSKTSTYYDKRMDSNNNSNVNSNRNTKNKPILAPGQNFKVEKLNASTTQQDNHNHAYVHKVEPIDEISVMNNENSTIAMLNEKREEQARENRADERRSDYLDRNAAKNADLHSDMSYGERKVICRYCGAENVVARGEKKTCYFCREAL